MRILALETSGMFGSVAALEDGRVLLEMDLERERRSAQTLAPGMEVVLRQVAWIPADVRLVAVAVGPGSFTGLRVGVTTAKAFAFAVGCPVVGVNTLEAIASRLPFEVCQCSVGMNAERRQVFAAEFDRGPNDDWERRGEVRIMDEEAWLAELVPGTVATGPALEKLVTRVPPGIIVSEAALWQPTAAAVGQLGWRQYLAGQRDDPMTLVPDYGRRTAAEEQWERKPSPSPPTPLLRRGEGG